MTSNEFGALILNLLIFITTLVNISYALINTEPLLIIVMYSLCKVFTAPPESGIVASCQHKSLFEESLSWHRSASPRPSAT
ncbi:BgTH12-04281 [Blumeria graminis f. sp. triticale]|uniref:BgTH12-04281 n=1 Tax=Blumeria graminis f. sp. triticale TaxID=1689686 RepID=A0A9W4CWS2_BLUGR|nr:BgTH12-04281 [Blumeria graminis f. sp. triticale]